METEQELKTFTNEILRHLTDREQIVIRARYGLDGEGPRTLQQIGEDCGVSRERIRQIEARAIRRLRNPELERGAEERRRREVNLRFGKGEQDEKEIRGK